jgi:phosphatidylinositol alpha-1,6-mannosyltransferase
MYENKILCITNDFGPRAGGIESFVIGLIERFPKNSVMVYTSSQEGDDAFDEMWLEKFGVKVIRDRSKILMPTFRVGRNVRKIIRSESIEKVFFGAAAPLGLLAAGLRRAGVKRIVALTHGHEVWWAKVFPFNLAIRRIGSTVDHLTYLGEYTKGAISKALNPKAKAAMVKIAPGINTKHFSPSAFSSELRNSLGLKDAKVIVSVGRLVHRKGQDRLIEALPKIKLSVPNAHLLFVGEGPYKEHLESLVSKNGMNGSVTFVGRVQYAELAKYMCVGDVFVMPSRSRFAGLEVEGLGIVYLEASACGLPVVAGKSGGAPDAVLEGVTGFAVDGTNLDEIADTTVRLLSDLETARQLGAQGKKWVEENWRWEIWAQKFQSLLQ